jgi:hypothetical protein
MSRMDGNSEQLLAWAETCDEIATAMEDIEAVAVSAEFVALRLRRVVAERDRAVLTAAQTGDES